MDRIAVSQADERLLDAAARMVGLLDAPEDSRVHVPLYRREIAWRLLTGPRRGLARQIGVTDGSLAIIARSVRWIRTSTPNRSGASSWRGLPT
jgi:hypothetical protein